MNLLKCYLAILAGLLAWPLVACASPYVPTDGSQVIETLAKRNAPEQGDLARSRRQLSLAPDNLALAVSLAQRYIAMGRRDADPRYLGYAQASLSPWWRMAPPPVPVLLLRATIWQSMHRFDDALADLDAVVNLDRGNPQAWLTRATVLQVQGRYAEAKASCARLYRIATPLVARICMSAASSLNGQAAESYKALLEALSADQNSSEDVKEWGIALLADIAWRLGDKPGAETHFRRALALDPSDSYLLGSYADFLLDQGRYGEVEALLKDKSRADPLLLRHALALQGLRSPAVVSEIETLRWRFEAAGMRQDGAHLREQSRFELQLMNRPDVALKLSQANWTAQKEPADARVLLEAALSARQPGAAKATIAWVKSRSLQDQTINRLVQALEQG